MKFSPHTWGCSGLAQTRQAPAERFPHTRGGVPWITLANYIAASVFPTPVGVCPFGRAGPGRLRGFPPRRGGVPLPYQSFQRFHAAFPTHVGGFPLRT